LIKGIFVQVNRIGVGPEGGVVENARPLGGLIGEKDVVELPELALGVGALGRLGCPNGLRPQISKVMVFEADQSRICVLFNELATRASGKLPTKRSLKVAVLFEENRRVGRPPSFAISPRRRLKRRRHDHVLKLGRVRLANHHKEGDDQYNRHRRQAVIKALLALLARLLRGAARSQGLPVLSRHI
jgi:hypothetical protein